ncbi:hypothetical protein YC2023_043983 [Brassica napus]
MEALQDWKSALKQFDRSTYYFSFYRSKWNLHMFDEQKCQLLSSLENQATYEDYHVKTYTLRREFKDDQLISSERLTRK